MTDTVALRSVIAESGLKYKGTGRDYGLVALRFADEDRQRVRVQGQ